MAREELVAQARFLSLVDEVRLLEDAMIDLRQHLEGLRSYSITELRGVGKEFWQATNVDKYIAEERSSWDS